MKKVVLTLHGVESRGEWQKELAPLLCTNGLTPYLLDYGHVPSWRILVAWIRTGKVKWLLEEIEKVRTIEGVDRPSIIAHSFGTYILARALDKYEQIRLDSVILCGSIVDPKFDWKRLYDRGQFNTLRNESGGKDLWAGLVKRLRWIISDVGPSGVEGFKQKEVWLHEKHFPNHGHSNFFDAGHARRFWIPFLREFRLGNEHIGRFRELLDVVRDGVANELGIAIENLRANVMLPSADSRHLYIPLGLASPEESFYVNDEGEKELEIEILVPTGCAGTAFKARKITTAVFVANWGQFGIAVDQLRRVDPDLRWIVSTPVPDPFDRASFGIVGILNVDCLLVGKTEVELLKLQELLKTRANQIAEAFKETYKLRR